MATTELTDGATSVTYLRDGHIELRTAHWFVDLDQHPRHRKLLAAEGPYLQANVGAILVRGSAGPTVLIDAGLGPVHAPRPTHDGAIIGALHGGDLLDSMATVGITPTDIDIICFTHLDDDHTGWLRRTDVFAAAELVIATQEWATLDPERQTAIAAGARTVRIVPFHKMQTRSDLQPIPAAGHTPGHSAYLAGQPPLALISGDAFHWHTQITHPDTHVQVDSDRNAAAATRRNLLNRAAVLGTPLVTAHLNPPVAHLTTANREFSWESTDDSDITL
ncbi:MBL fold metallo-hydrolase [Gordonia sputi]